MRARVGFDRDRTKQPPSPQRDPRPEQRPGLAPRAGLRQATRGGFEQARGALGFAGHDETATWSLTPDGGALRPVLPVPGVLADLVPDGLALAGGAAVDLLDSETERRRKARERGLVDSLRARAPGLQSVGEALGTAADHHLANPRALGVLDRGFRPVQASPRGAFSGSVELALGGNGRRVDVGTGEVSGLVHFALENGVQWVYDEIDKVRAWAERHRQTPFDEPASSGVAGPGPAPRA